jgi:membrane protein required for colicin V production
VNGFNAVDIVALVWLLIGAWRGLRQGLAGALLRLLALALAVGVGFLGYAWLGEKMAGGGRLAGAAGDLLAFFLITVAVYVVLRLVGLLLKNTITFTFKGKLEPVGGALVGLLVSACVIALVLLLAGQWPQPLMKKWFVEESWLGGVVHEQLGPVWQRLEKRYPALKLPDEAGPEHLENTLKDVKDDSVKTVERAGQAAEQKVKQAKKRMNDAVVEGTKK